MAFLAPILPYVAAAGAVASGAAAVIGATKGGGGGGSVIMPPSPKTTEPVIPRIDDAAVELQRKRTIAGQVAARGRAATVLTQPTGGFEAATGNKLGG